MIQARPHVVPLVILASLLALSGRPAHAVDGRTAYLVRDLDPGEAYESTIALDPVATLGNRVLLTAGDPASGSELWVTDGTGVGTRLLVDACPGSCSSVIRVLGTLGGKTIWAAAPTDRFGSASRSWRLWITDGTRAGTRPLTEPGALPDDPEEETFAFAGGRLYFAGCTTADSCGLWTTDGTPEGTGPVPGLASTHGRPSQLTAVGDRVFFNAFNELWVSDGSGPGSVRLKS
ncbi:MAG TPA: hypothetical protein VHU81_12435, partial [Thermoanaerobaculia bacterium]|nr:hypothetical protein [Thermoanaerobaculia bacterium]